MKTIHRSLIIGCSLLALSACGPEEISSPGTGGDVIINNPTPSPSPTPTPTPTSAVTAAAECPTISDPAGLTDSGVLNVPQGTVRVCTLPKRFTANSTLPYVSGVAYRMNGRVDVGSDGGPAVDNSDGLSDTNVTLSIEPGVVVYAGTGVSYLVVNRGNDINAQGTSTKPIIFTSEANVIGNTTDNSSGQWGGVVLLGRAQITDCLDAGATPGTIACQRDTEGSPDPALFGGATNDDSSGVMRYVQIRYSGYVLSGDNELQSLTTGGIGSNTQIDHFMSVNSSDDAIEMFGGHVNAKYLVLVGAEDDNLDTDTGVKANIQYVIAVQRDGIGDTIIEADTNNTSIENTPRQLTQVSNATFIHRNSAANPVVRIRGAADYALVNSVVYAQSGSACVRLDLAETIRAADSSKDDKGPPVFNSVVMDCTTAFRDGDNVTAAQAKAIFDAGSNNNSAFTNTLSMTFVNGTNETAVAAFDPTTLSSFFDAVTYVGAVKEGDTWYQGWTCDSTAADFGVGISCAESPVT